MEMHTSGNSSRTSLARAHARPRAFLAALLCAVLATACGGEKPGNGDSSAAEATIQVGVLGILADAPLYVAQAEGYFEEAGLNVEIQTFGSTPDLLPALATGQLDVAWGGYAAGLIQAVARDIPVMLVASHARAVPGTTTVLFARDDLAGSKPEMSDLVRHKVAVNAPGNVMHAYLFKALSRTGIDPAAVDVTEMPFTNMPAALASGSVDAAITVDPLTSVVRAQKLGVEVTNGYEMWGESHDVGILMYSPDFAERQSAGESFMTAYLRAQRLIFEAYANDDPEAKELVLAAVKQQVSAIDEKIADSVFLNSGNPDGHIDRSSIQDFMDTFADMGMLDGVSSPDLEKRVDDSYVDAALEELGTHK